MADNRKKRMSLLDNLAAAGAAPPAETTSMMTANRALRSARDAVDGHHVWELDPRQVRDLRPADRLEVADVEDLRDAIEANGQTVPILVRRDPDNKDCYLLIYGRRRLEAILSSDKVEKIRAIVANMDDEAALRAQVSENIARRDLSYIEKALLAKTLVASGFGNQTQVAEVLTVSKSSVSMAITIAETVTEELARAIGPAQGVGRPKWDALARLIADFGADTTALTEIATRTRDDISLARINEETDELDASQVAFDAVMKAATPVSKPPAPKAAASAKSRALTLGGAPAGIVKRNAKGLTIALTDSGFAAWVDAQAQDLITELHARYTAESEEK